MAITLPNGYKMTTTFFEDFYVAEQFGINAVQETFDMSFNSYKNDHIYLTELSVVMSNNSIAHYGSNDELSKLYTKLYYKVDDYCMDNLKGKELDFYLSITD